MAIAPVPASISRRSVGETLDLEACGCAAVAEGTRAADRHRTSTTRTSTVNPDMQKTYPTLTAVSQ